MREIKLRAWDKEARRFISTELLLLSFDGRLTNSAGEFINYADRYEVMQFTGLHDRTGRKIFEGDIIEDQWGDDLTCRGVVEYDEGWYGIKLQAGPEWPEHHTPLNEGQGTVIGNQWENPELLK